MLSLMKLGALRLRTPLTAAFAATAALVGGCSLVLGDLPPTTSGQAGSGGGGASSGGASSGGASSGGASGGASAGNGQGGAGAAPGGSSGTGGRPSNCDEDGDGFDSKACERGEDCNDMDDTVKPMQSEYFPNPHGPDESFDYNCDDEIELEGPIVSCPMLAPCPPEQGFLEDVACGASAPWGNCRLDSTGLSCVEAVIVEARPRGCR